MLTFINKIKNNFDSATDFYNFIRVFILITIITILLKLISVKKILELFNPEFRSNEVREFEIIKLARYTDSLLNISFQYFDSNCLRRSLVLFCILRKIGIDVTFNVGIKSSGLEHDRDIKRIGKLDGHAWISLHNKIYLEKLPEITQTYKVIFSYS